MLPLAILVGTLVGFGVLTKSNQVTAMLSTGTSIYRAALPVPVRMRCATWRNTSE
jgi:lipopolysaccharide export LptBFGC system permease protein LptF